jgi:hypothetical protein
VRTFAAIASVVAVLVVAGCGDASSPDDGGSATPPASTGQEQPAEQEPAEPAQPAEQEPPAQQWVMPNLVGTVLQDAQNQIQALSGGAVYFTDSHDLTGQSRNQVLDANWKVCTQNIAAGAALTSASTVYFGVVKVEEACP